MIEFKPLKVFRNRQSSKLYGTDYNIFKSFSLLRGKNKFIKSGIIAGNVFILAFVGMLVIGSSGANETVRQSTATGEFESTGVKLKPLDQLSSSQIALTAAQLIQTPELNAVKNVVDSEQALQLIASQDSNVISKPQVVATSAKSKADIIKYTSVDGDTVDTLAARFGVSGNSIKWSNEISESSLKPGTSLVIPPAEGIVYKVKAGETIDDLVSKYSVNRDTFISVNDVEHGSLSPNEYIWIPNAQQPAPKVVFTAASRGGTVASPSFSAIYGGNGYDRGYCTWWAATRRAQIGRPVPNNLGNAITWKVLANRAGIGIGQTPANGAVIWTPASYGEGHVGFVERVNEDGSVWVSDMNSYGLAAMDLNSGGAGGWGRVSYKLLSPAQAAGYWYIY